MRCWNLSCSICRASAAGSDAGTSFDASTRIICHRGDCVTVAQGSTAKPSLILDQWIGEAEHARTRTGGRGETWMSGNEMNRSVVVHHPLSPI
ncbi:hypothetical protein BDQ94DRAFT_152336, partial [Aspergillus welwitschiae]